MYRARYQTSSALVKLLNRAERVFPFRRTILSARLSRSLLHADVAFTILMFVRRAKTLLRYVIFNYFSVSQRYIGP